MVDLMVGLVVDPVGDLIGYCWSNLVDWSVMFKLLGPDLPTYPTQSFGRQAAILLQPSRISQRFPVRSSWLGQVPFSVEL